MPAPLAHLRVVDLTDVRGAFAGRLLADLGAEVVKIESRANLDLLRLVTIEPDQPDRAWTFDDESRGQKSVALDLATPRGRAVALRLCATADVVVENNRGGVVEAWGLDYDDVQNADDHRADPHLVARGAIVTAEHPEVGPERHIGNPIRMSLTRLADAAPAPRLGEHTEDVLTRLLGLERAEVACLVDERVCR